MTTDYFKLLDWARVTQESGAPGEHVQLLLTGPPGGGKTSLVFDWADSINYAVDVNHLGNTECVDMGGMWAPNFDTGELMHMNTSRYLGLNIPDDKDGLVVFLDEIGLAQPDVQASILPLVESRMHENRPISNNVVFVGATNRESDNCGVGEIIQSLKARFMEVKMDVDNKKWVTWAMKNGLDRNIVSLINWKGELLNHFDPDQADFGQPNPRSWHKLSAMMKQDTSEEMTLFLATAIVGSGAAGELVGFMRFEDTLATVREILEEPDTAMLPAINISAQYATITNIAYWATEKKRDKSNILGSEAEAIITYLRRMTEALAVFGFKMIDSANDTFSTSTGEYGRFVVEYQKYGL